MPLLLRGAPVEMVKGVLFGLSLLPRRRRTLATGSLSLPMIWMTRGRKPVFPNLAAAAAAAAAAAVVPAAAVAVVPAAAAAVVPAAAAAVVAPAAVAVVAPAAEEATLRQRLEWAGAFLVLMLLCLRTWALQLRLTGSL